VGESVAVVQGWVTTIAEQVTRAGFHPRRGGAAHPSRADADSKTYSDQERGVTDVADQDAEVLGPISYLIVEFPGNKMTGEGLEALVELVDAGLITILDLEFVCRGADGSIAGISLNDIDHDGEFDVTVFEGVSSGMLDQSDFDEAGKAISPGSSAAILIFENRWATKFVQGIKRGGAELVAAGYIPQVDVAAALDATDA
jgi:hypothetical protein